VWWSASLRTTSGFLKGGLVIEARRAFEFVGYITYPREIFFGIANTSGLKATHYRRNVQCEQVEILFFGNAALAWSKKPIEVVCHITPLLG
jgi:hypothetical protein